MGNENKIGGRKDSSRKREEGIRGKEAENKVRIDGKGGEGKGREKEEREEYSGVKEYGIHTFKA